MITQTVAVDFFSPEVSSLTGHPEQLAIVPVKKAASDVNERFETSEDNIRGARQLFVMKSKAKAAGMEPAAYQHFRFRILAADGSHIAAAGLFVVNVRQLRPPVSAGQ